MERRLAAVLIADVVGYGRLSQADEEGTRARFQADLREVFEPRIAAHHGRLVKTMGDGLLVEFHSVVGAVRCAVEVQRAKSARDAGVAADRRLAFRIGINLGDVIVEGDDIHGDGVIIAERLQTLADSGGVTISGTAFDHAIHKADVGFAYLGEQHVKNIDDPVRVYRVLLDPAAAGKVVGATHKAGARLLILGVAGALAIAAVATLLVWQWPVPPDRPSVAVLPFANLSGDPREEYFADGLTDDLITDLAKLSGLVVIARNSVFTYKGRPVLLPQVARDLNVRYVVEGSVRRSGDRIRVNAKLIDTATGDHLVAKEFDRSASDVFAIEDEVVRHVVEALGVQPTAPEQLQLARPPTANLEAYDYYLRGEQAERTGLFRDALQLYAKATTLDPSFADAYAADARTAVNIWRNVDDDILPGPVARKRAYEKAGRALELNPDFSRPYAILAILQVVDRRYEEALDSAKRAVALGPSDAEAHAALSLVLTFSGRHADAVAAIETAQRFNPSLSASERQVAGMAFFLQRDYVRAIEMLERARAETPRPDGDLLAAAYARAGRLNKARDAAAEVRRLVPVMSVELCRILYAPFRNGEDLELLLDAMREAGLPQWPFDFRGEDRDRLSGDDISRLAFGRTWRGRTEEGGPALLQFGRDGKTAFRTPTQITTGTAFVDREMLCQQSENILLGRPRCGPVYRRSHGAGDPAYTYVNGFTLFYFSPVE